jgi:hypothetical protein
MGEIQISPLTPTHEPRPAPSPPLHGIHMGAQLAGFMWATLQPGADFTTLPTGTTGGPPQHQGITREATAAGLRGAAIAMQASGSWQAAADSFLEAATAWRLEASPSPGPSEAPPVNVLENGSINWHSYNFPMVTATAYIGVWRRGRTHASARPTTHCGDAWCQTCGPPTCITCNGPYLGSDEHRLRATRGSAQLVDIQLRGGSLDPHAPARATRAWLSSHNHVIFDRAQGAFPFLTIHRKYALLCRRHVRAARTIQNAWHLFARRSTQAILNQILALPSLGVRPIIAAMVHGPPPQPDLAPMGSRRTLCPYSSDHHSWIPTFEPNPGLMYEVD